MLNVKSPGEEMLRQGFVVTASEPGLIMLLARPRGDAS